MEATEGSNKKLRTGFTTGTCATASSKAALLAIIQQNNISGIDVLLPKRDRIQIKINTCKFSKDSARCSVIKDGGDDPDAVSYTHLTLPTILLV